MDEGPHDRTPRGAARAGKRLALPAVLAVSALFGLVPGAGIAQANHYDHLLAPLSLCPKQTDLDRARVDQERTMRCMHRYARREKDRPRIYKSNKLQRSSAKKAHDIIECDHFSHTACGRDAFHWFAWSGFLTGCYKVGENLTLGSSYKGNVRNAMSNWLHSDGHRRALLDRDFDRFGISMVRGDWKGYRVQVWAAHFGTHC